MFRLLLTLFDHISTNENFSNWNFDRMEKWSKTWINGRKLASFMLFFMFLGTKVDKAFRFEWKNGLKEGQGILTTETSEYVEKFITRFSPNSTFDEVIDDEESHISKTIKIIGEFKSDILWNGNEYDEDGKILKKYVNGEEIEE